MKSMTSHTAPVSGAETAVSSLSRRFSMAIDATRTALAERALRRELAELDTSVLRDIGVADDEIWRIRRRERFTPRNWN